MKMMECPDCLTLVIPSENGECPACRSKLPEHFESLAQSEAPWTPELPEPIDEPVTLARFIDPLEAEMARNCLEASGIRAFLTDTRTLGMAWQLSNALGGMKLEVSSRYLTRAQAILDEQLHSSASDIHDLEEQAINMEAVSELDHDEIQYEYDQGEEAFHEDEYTNDNPEEDVIREPTEREIYAVSAFRSAIFGIIFIPLQLYTTYFIFVVLSSNERLEGSVRNRFYLAIAINLAYCLTIALLIRYSL